MSVRLFSIALSSLFFLTQAHEMRASDPIKDESPRQMKKRLLPPSPTIKLDSSKTEQKTTSQEGTKTRRKKSENPSPAAVDVSLKEGNSSAAATPKAKNPQDTLNVLLGETSQKKKEIFSPPKTLDVYETLLVLFAGQEGSKHNKIHLVRNGQACSFDSLHTKTMLEFEAFLHAAKVKENAGFKYLKDIFLIKDPKATVITTKAEEITKSLKSTEEVTKKLQSREKKYSGVELEQLKAELSQIQAGQRAFAKIEDSRKYFDYLLLELSPGNNKDRSLFEITAKYEHDEKRPFSTLAAHDSVYGWYRLHVRDEPTDFVFGVQLYRMISK
ncbi:MAG: hypothetical protein BGO76_02030 [Caedibacter sp. 38-128]|nr:hypothetical protein [Holosporales bacterium]OJX08519.1 MAG: hypothetical protein BGO76_02030 [Caedibacter sp. 38-128]